MVSSRTLAIVCGVDLLHGVSAWLPSPLRVPTSSTGQRWAVRDIVAGEHHHVRQQWSALRSAADGEGGGGAGRPDLASMKRSFEGTMDNKLIMEYVMALRSRKALLLSSLEKTGGVITDDIYPIMEELALVNPSSGCGVGKDLGKSHYCAMLPGHWIAASTIVPNVPFVYGDGEKATNRSPSSRGAGPTCTLGELVSSISGRPVSGGELEYNADTPVRPLRARISALTNTVKDGEMPTVVAVAGFSPAADAQPVKATGSAAGTAAGGGGEDPKDAQAKALAAAMMEAAAREPRAAAAAGGAGVRAEGFGRVADVVMTEDGAVRGRGKWGVQGGYHLRWEFNTMNLDLGGDKIVKAGGEGGDGGRDLYEFFLDQNMLIVAWKDAPKKEDAVVFVRDEVPR
ncbi:unnamed protein product [Ectocarpus sp. 12 AP-2014]